MAARSETARKRETAPTSGAAPRSGAAAAPPELVLHITRVFDAPRSLVFWAWTEPEHLARWCAPHGFAVTDNGGDLRPGGAWRTCMTAPDGTEHRAGGVYVEVVRDERLVFTHAWEGSDEKSGHETLVTVTFADEGGKTRMTFHQSVFKSAATRNGHEGGWSQSFERLAGLLREFQEQEAASGRNH